MELEISPEPTEVERAAIVAALEEPPGRPASDRPAPWQDEGDEP